MKDNNKFNVGDYVISKSGRKGVIEEFNYSRFHLSFLYTLPYYEDRYFPENSLSLMTQEQIEMFKMSKTTDKFNI